MLILCDIYKLEMKRRNLIKNNKTFRALEIDLLRIDRDTMAEMADYVYFGS